MNILFLRPSKYDEVAFNINNYTVLTFFLLLIIRISSISGFLSTHLLVKVKWQIILKMKEQ